MGRKRETPTGVVLEQLDALGIEYKVRSKNHSKVYFQANGRKLIYVVPITTSDGRRTLKNCRCGIRRLLRQEGLLKQ